MALTTWTRAYPLYVNVLRVRVSKQQMNVNCDLSSCLLLVAYQYHLAQSVLHHMR